MPTHADYKKLLEKARTRTNTNPTLAQIESERYAKGKCKLHGLTIAIENPKGSTRKGVDDDGNEWSSKMHADYGEIEGTEGADGDRLDVFIGPYPASELVVVINQVNPKTKKFDEHKVMLGTTNREEAESLYLKNYDKGWKGLKSSTVMAVDDFKEWLKGDTTKQAVFTEAAICCGQEAVKIAAALRPAAEVFQRALQFAEVSKPVSIYINSETKQSAFGEEILDLPADEQASLRELLKSAAVAPGRTANPENPLWVKVAASGAVRTLGQVGQFFPGKFMGVPNSPGPIQSMLATGLLGAGAGYGLGWLGSQFLPEGYDKEKIKKTLAIGGGLLGAAPGLAWGLTNRSTNKPFNDPSLLSGSTLNFSEKVSADAEAVIDRVVKSYAQERDDWAKQAESQWSDDALAVNINSMGQLLWDSGASPDTAAMTMGALHAAERMPGGVGRGWATPRQIGQLAVNMGAGYIAGTAAGATLGHLAGMPSKDKKRLAGAGLVLGVVNTVVPRIFGG